MWGLRAYAETSYMQTFGRRCRYAWGPGVGGLMPVRGGASAIAHHLAILSGVGMNRILIFLILKHSLYNAAYYKAEHPTYPGYSVLKQTEASQALFKLFHSPNC